MIKLNNSEFPSFEGWVDFHRKRQTLFQELDVDHCTPEMLQAIYLRQRCKWNLYYNNDNKIQLIVKGDINDN